MLPTAPTATCTQMSLSILSSLRLKTPIRFLDYRATLPRTCREAESTSVYDQMMALHRKFPNRSADDIQKDVHVEKLKLTEMNCPAIKAQFSKFQQLRLALPQFDVVILHPLVHEFRIERAVGIWTLLYTTTRTRLSRGPLRRGTNLNCVPGIVPIDVFDASIGETRRLHVLTFSPGTGRQSWVIERNGDFSPVETIAHNGLLWITSCLPAIRELTAVRAFRHQASKQFRAIFATRWRDVPLVNNDLCRPGERIMLAQGFNGRALERSLPGTRLADGNPRMKHFVNPVHQVYSRNRLLKECCTFGNELLSHWNLRESRDEQDLHLWV